MSLFDVPGADEYEIEEEVGHGTFSEVHRARHRTTGQLVALKHMYLQQEGALPLHIRRELELLQTVRHPGLLSLLGVKEQGHSVALVLEYCLADLRTLLAALRGTALDAAVAKGVAQQLLRALAACHAAGYVHRDVAPANVLVSQGGAIKLADFGQTRRVRDAENGRAGANLNSIAASNGLGGSDGAPAAASFTGMAATNGLGDSESDSEAGGGEDGGLFTPGAAICTRWYKAPELLFNARRYGTAVDLWSVGCILAELLTGRPLFAGSSDIMQLVLMSDLLGSISEERWPGVRELPDWGKLVFTEQPPGDMGAALRGAPPEAVHLVAGLLQYNPEHRLSAEQALASPYFSQEPLPPPPEVLLAVVRQALV